MCISENLCVRMCEFLKDNLTVFGVREFRVKTKTWANTFSFFCFKADFLFFVDVIEVHTHTQMYRYMHMCMHACVWIFF